jgi:glutathione-regulated potassium-efflux system ancillary protein KefG
MRKILILFAHPRFEHAVVNRALVAACRQNPAVTFHDLYELYPDFNIDIAREQALLLNHDVIVWHHPFYWYSCPPLLKQWIDMVLEFNWAYGPNGDKLAGKIVFNTITTGGNREAYQTGGRNRFPVNSLLLPFDQTAFLCKMKYLPPFAVQGTHRLSREELSAHAENYSKLLQLMADSDFDPESLKHLELLNDYFINTTIYGR